ncbi:hypothetical protein BCR39DRAFT_466255, partial [Naematelia encephala]
MVETAYHKPMDVDKCEISYSPDNYQRQYNSAMASVQLPSHVPRQKPRRAGQAGSAFEGWMLLGEANHQLWIDPKYKEEFMEELDKYQDIRKSKHWFQAALGNPVVPVSVFVHCLKVAQCPTIRLKLYGQKLPLEYPFYSGEPAEVAHPMAKYNEWDIGVTTTANYIYLFAPANGTKRSVSLFPMIIPGSLDFGSIQIKLRHQNKLYKVKIYPRLVHVIKSFNSRIQGEKVKTFYGLRHRSHAAQEMIHNLSTLEPSQLGGYRIEVSVQAPTLNMARRLVNSTPFLRLESWLNPETEGGLTRFKLNAKIVTKQGLLSNANWVFQQAQSRGLLTGDDSRQPTPVQRRVVVDIYAAFGWNAGVRRPTKSLNSGAWWIDQQEE